MEQPSLSAYFPIWDKLTPAQQDTLVRAAVPRTAPKGTALHNGAADCVGLFVVRSGMLRAFVLSDEGREVTLYRLFDRDICLFSASCMIQSIQFDLYIEAEKDTSLWVIPADVYKRVMEQNAALANYTSQLIATRFSDVMWLMEQILWKSMDRRLAAFLLEESALEASDTLTITHDRIAAHLGTAREVVTRMLRYFQSEGLVELARGEVRLKSEAGLRALAEASAGK